MDEEIVTVSCRCDDFLKARRHREDPQRRMSDAEVMTVAFVAMRCFGGNFRKAASMLDHPRYIPRMLSESRLCRRLHDLTPLFEVLFRTWAEAFKGENASGDSTDAYLVDSFSITPSPRRDDATPVRHAEKRSDEECRSDLERAYFSAALRFAQV